MLADLFPFRHQLRAGTLAAVQHLPEEHWDWKPPGAVHTIKSWLWHMAEIEDRLSGREPRRRTPRVEREQVLDYLAETRAATERLLQMASADDRMAYETAWRIFEHETHHRAQIYLYIRLMGLQPPRI